MKKMKIVSALMAMAMSVTSMGLVASAASDVNVKIGKETVEKGATFSVDVDLSSLPSTGLSSIDFAISYDKSVIKPTKVTLGKAGNTGAAAQEGDLGSTLFDSYITDDQIIIIWATGLTDSKYWIKSDGVCYAIYEADDDASIRELMKRGIKFEHTDYRQGEWKELKAYGVRRKKPENAVSAEINKIAKKPVKQVKPGYKKKRAAAIEKVKRKHRREMIESNIKALSKEKNRLKQRQKNIESGKYD